MINNKNKSNIPNKAFDMEYSTQWKEEYTYLKNKYIYPTYIKFNYEYKIKTYKYKKTPELFRALASFYTKKEEIKPGESISYSKFEDDTE